MIQRALLSVAAGDGLVELAADLAELGCEIVATNAAHHALCAAGIASIDVARFNGVDEDFEFPPTLHPRMERALTGAADASSRIDLVFDIPYGIETGNDVGGLTLLALAAKGRRLPVAS